MKISDYFSLMPAVFEIKQLMGMISNEADREELAMLDKDRLSTRSEIKEKVDRIVARQPVEIQDAYLGILRKKIAQDDEQYETEIQELKEQGAPQEVLEVKKQMHIFESDWSLSKQDAERMETELVAALSKSERDLLSF
ncbi:hypothetical protein Tcan_11766 [Toxocara canis]|uniref:Uncharacterized protein n=1 Tax=Toxocara canis TaxID=6265 RepID=A0A0B2UTZ6_TOXCA|nr:hypothetical protein Tcan_11766 [Toxocara canis]